MIAICILARDMVHMPFAACLGRLLYDAGAHGLDVVLIPVYAGHPTEGRNFAMAKVVSHPQAKNITHVLWLDTDMPFPADTLRTLLAHECDIVGATASKRLQPGTPAHQELPEPDTRDLAQVHRIGGAVLLVRMAVYRKLGAFKFANRESEDYTFCAEAQAQGFTVWLDRALSADVRHLTVAGLALNGTMEQPRL